MKKVLALVTAAMITMEVASGFCIAMSSVLLKE